jgi:hypothetical protein
MFGGLVSIVLGVCGWMIAKLLFEPAKEILELRREAQEYLIIYGNLSADAPLEERRMAADSFRRVGAGLSSRHIAAYPWVRAAFRRLSWDIHSAGELLLGLANGTQFQGFSRANTSPTAQFIRDCLRLPPIEQSAMQHALTENLVRAHVDQELGAKFFD